MAKNNESTMKWKVDIGQLTKAMQEAKRSISIANAEFKTATAGMDKWSKSTTGLEAKLKQLNATLPQQRKILGDLERQYEITAKNMGENSKEAQDLRIKIEEQRATIVKTETNINKYNNQLDQMQKEQAESKTAYGQLNKTIEEQQSKVDDLKQAYKNAVIQYGENSKEAKTLAKEIESLSGELADNKKKMDDADKSASNLDKSIDDAGDSANEAAKGGFTVLKGAMANLVSEGISKAIDGLKQLAGKVVEVGKQSISEYANYEQLVGGVETLFKDSADIVEEYADRAFKTAGMSANNYMETVTSFSASLLQGLNGDTAKAAKIADMAIIDMSDNANKMGSDISSLQNAYQGFAKGNFTMLDNLKLGYGGTKTEMLRLVKDAGVVEDSVKSIDDVSFDQIIEAIHIIQTEMDITGTTSKEAATTIEGSKNSMMASWSNLLKEMAKSDGDIGGAFDTFVESAMTYLNNLLPRIQELMGNVVGLIREKLEETAPEFLDFVDDVKSAFDKIIPVIQDTFGWILENKDLIISALAGIAAGFVAFKAFTFISSIVGTITTLFSAIQAGIPIMAALNTVMAANPIGLIIAAIAGLVVAFITLWNTSEEFRNFWIGLWENVKEITSTVIEAIATWFSGLWDSIVNIWNQAGEFFTGIWEGIKQVFAPVIEFFSTIFSNAWTMVQNIWLIATVFFQYIWDGIKAVFAPVIEWFRNIFQSAWDGIKNIWNAVKGFFQSIWNGIKNVFTPVVNWFKDTFEKAWKAIKGVFSAVGEFFGGIWETIKEKFTNIGQKVGDAIGGAFKTAVNAVLATAENVLNAPINAINSLIGKLKGIPGLGGLGTLSTISLPRLAQGGVLKKGQIGLLEGDGAEAVVPLEKNKKWIARVVKEMVEQLDVNGVKNSLRGNVSGMNGGDLSGASVTNQNLTFNQYNTSPKALDRLSIYRDTKSMLFSAKVRMQDV